MNVVLGQEKLDLEKKRRRKKIFIIILLIIINVSVILLSILLQKNSEPKNKFSGNIFPESGAAEKGHLPKMTTEEILEQMQREADKSVFSFKINSQPVFENGNKDGNLQIENPNHNIYPFVVEILLNENGEKVYDSGGILPNHHINRAKLIKVLEKGEYPATAYIHAYDPTTKEYIGKSSAELKLIIRE